jgi:hypothetical protein
MKWSVIAIVGAAAGAAGCAATGPSAATAGDRAALESETDCLWTRTITDWNALDERNLIVYSGRQPFHVELSQQCFDLDFATVIAFYDRSGDERICGFGMDRVIVDRTIPESCGIAAVDELTEEQAEALDERFTLERQNRGARRR